MSKPNIALFDFDGTITRKDSFIAFILFAVGKFRFLLGLIILLPVLIRYNNGSMPNYVAKQKVLKHFFKGMKLSVFNEKADLFSRTVLPGMIRKSAVHKMLEHKVNGDEVVVVSASISNYLKHWCELQDVSLLATEVEVIDGKLTGNLGCENCYGDEKIRRIIEAFPLQNFDKIYAYGDSEGDRQMLELSHFPAYRSFID